MRLFVAFISVLIVACAFHARAEGPALPTEDVVKQTRVENVEALELPYQPAQNVENADGTEEPLDPTQPVIEWSKVPYVPSHYPVVGPARDPEI
ncbi:MAG TPA: hypothetical protein VJC18_02615 [bacterium]|nr:hypothetical protein [bacterium]